MIKRKIEPEQLIWKSEYNIGDYKVDLEHQSLFKLAKKALSIRTMEDDEKETQELKNVIKSLYEYVAQHFAHEEVHMEKIGYPELERHKIVHKELLKTLHEFVQTLNDLTIDEIEFKLYRFIEDYFIDHIVQEDMHIGIWVTSLQKLRHTTKWRTEYNTGNRMMDKEHQELFSILEEAFETVDDDKREAKIKLVLHHLYDLIKKHFHSEERYMEKINYPEYEKHKNIHNQIVQSCNELLLQINTMDMKLFEKELAYFIDTHIVGHMITEDKKVVEFSKTVLVIDE